MHCIAVACCIMIKDCQASDVVISRVFKAANIVHDQYQHRPQDLSVLFSY